MDVFLQSCVHYHFRRLPETCVDDFHSRVAKSTCDNLCAAVVSIEAGFGYEDTNREAHTYTVKIIERRLERLFRNLFIWSHKREATGAKRQVTRCFQSSYDAMARDTGAPATDSLPRRRLHVALPH